MPDIIKCGVVNVIALKKCGSGQLLKSFKDKNWTDLQFPEGGTRYVTFLRNPAQRLVSCWYHLVRPRVGAGGSDDDTAMALQRFGPRIPFIEWVEWILRQDPDRLNAHMRPQTLELADALRGVEPDALLWLGMLERSQELAKNELREWLRWSIAMRNQYPKKGYGLWRDHYPPPLLAAVREYFADDYKLWLSLFEQGYKVVDTYEIA